MPDIRPPHPDLLDEIAQLQQRSAQLLNIRLTDPPAEIVEKLKQHVGYVADSGESPDEDGLAGLAVVLGQQYVRAFGWHWCEVNFKEDGRDAHFVAAVLNADESLAIVPVWWLADILDGEKSNGLFLHFNLVAANSLPVAEPKAALIVH